MFWVSSLALFTLTEPLPIESSTGAGYAPDCLDNLLQSPVRATRQDVVRAPRFLRGGFPSVFVGPWPQLITRVLHMPEPLVLASSSVTRARLLRNAGLAFASEDARLDEAAVRDALLAEGAGPRDIADTLAEMKALRISARHPTALVIGSDQVLAVAGRVLGKAEDMSAARDQLLLLRDRQHLLLSAVVVCQGGEPLWRHVGEARMRMRAFSEEWLDDYLLRNAEAVLASVGGYRIEEEGVRLFSAIEGDYFTILGLPLLPLLSWLSLRGTIPS